MANTRYTWFIDTKGDPKTNVLIASELDEWYECRDKLCQDGVRRNLWRCPSREFLQSFQRIANANRFKYDIYVREGDYGPIRLWIFERRSKEERKNRIKKMPLKHLIEEAVMIAGA
jgi:hypothetical protein